MNYESFHTLPWIGKHFILFHGLGNILYFSMNYESIRFHTFPWIVFMLFHEFEKSQAEQEQQEQFSPFLWTAPSLSRSKSLALFKIQFFGRWSSRKTADKSSKHKWARSEFDQKRRWKLQPCHTSTNSPFSWTLWGQIQQTSTRFLRFSRFSRSGSHNFRAQPTSSRPRCDSLWVNFVLG